MKDKQFRTFSCNFGKSVSCRIQVTDKAPEKGSQHILLVEWSGRPGKWTLRPYIAWMNSVNKYLSDEWGVKLMHVFQLKPNWESCEIWVYEPNKPPKKEALSKY